MLTLHISSRRLFKHRAKMIGHAVSYDDDTNFIFAQFISFEPARVTAFHGFVSYISHVHKSGFAKLGQKIISIQNHNYNHTNNFVADYIYTTFFALIKCIYIHICMCTRYQICM